MAERLQLIVQAVDQSSKTLKRIEGNTKKLSVISVQAFLGIASQAARAARAITDFATAGIKFADRVDDISLRTGAATETISALGFAAERSGSSLGAVQTGFRTLQARILDASQGLAESKRSFEELGIEVENADGSLRTIDDILPELADAFKNMTDDTKASAVAQEVLGRAGLELLPVLRGGREGLEAFAKEADKLGVLLTKETTESLSQVDDKMVNATTSVKGLQVSMGEFLAPTIESLSDLTVTITGVMRDLITEITGLTSGFTDFFNASVNARLSTADLAKKTGDLRLEYRQLLIDTGEAKQGTIEFTTAARRFDDMLESNKAKAFAVVEQLRRMQVQQVLTKESTEDLATKTKDLTTEFDGMAGASVTLLREGESMFDQFGFLDDLFFRISKTAKDEVEPAFKAVGDAAEGASSKVSTGFSNAFSNALTAQRNFFEAFQDEIKAFLVRLAAQEIGQTIGNLIFPKQPAGGVGVSDILGVIPGGGIIAGIGSLLGFQGGGTVPGPRRAAQDTTIIRTTPGEEVLSVGLSDQLRQFLSAARSGGQGGGTVVNIGSLEVSDVRMIDLLMEGFNKATEFRGRRLVASETL